MRRGSVRLGTHAHTPRVRRAYRTVPSMDAERRNASCDGDAPASSRPAPDRKGMSDAVLSHRPRITAIHGTHLGPCHVGDGPRVAAVRVARHRCKDGRDKLVFGPWPGVGCAGRLDLARRHGGRAHRNRAEGRRDVGRVERVGGGAALPKQLPHAHAAGVVAAGQQVAGRRHAQHPHRGDGRPVHEVLHPHQARKVPLRLVVDARLPIGRACERGPCRRGRVS